MTRRLRWTMAQDEVERRVLRTAVWLVPAGERAEFLRVWEAELWHKREERDRRRLTSGNGLAAGVLRDALWLRGESLRRRFAGTALLCIAVLAGGCVGAGLLGLALEGGARALGERVAEQAGCFLTAAAIVMLVAFVVGPRRPAEAAWEGRLVHGARRGVFLGTRCVLLLTLAYLLSLDLLAPMHVIFPLTADLFEMGWFVFVGLVGLRWAFLDQDQRCKQCLRALGGPLRVGRPSRNLLEWNGTRLACRDGHGLLSVPELETSWAPTSEWIAREA